MEKLCFWGKVFEFLAWTSSKLAIRYLTKIEHLNWPIWLLCSRWHSLSAHIFSSAFFDGLFTRFGVLKQKMWGNLLLERLLLFFDSSFPIWLSGRCWARIELIDKSLVNQNVCVKRRWRLSRWLCQNWVWELVDTSPLHIKHSECLDIGHTLVDLWSNRGIDSFVVQVGNI